MYELYTSTKVYKYVLKQSSFIYFELFCQDFLSFVHMFLSNDLLMVYNLVISRDTSNKTDSIMISGFSVHVLNNYHVTFIQDIVNMPRFWAAPLAVAIVN